MNHTTVFNRGAKNAATAAANAINTQSPGTYATVTCDDDNIFRTVFTHKNSIYGFFEEISKTEDFEYAITHTKDIQRSTIENLKELIVQHFRDRTFKKKGFISVASLSDMVSKMNGYKKSKYSDPSYLEQGVNTIPDIDILFKAFVVCLRLICNKKLLGENSSHIYSKLGNMSFTLLENETICLFTDFLNALRTYIDDDIYVINKKVQAGGGSSKSVKTTIMGKQFVVYVKHDGEYMTVKQLKKKLLAKKQKKK